MITVERLKVGEDVLYEFKGEPSDFSIHIDSDGTPITMRRSDIECEHPFLQKERPVTLEELRDKIDMINNNLVKFLLTPQTPIIHNTNQLC